tara:strand:- start:845 stop:2479 length:1635 start_codon:yes stop_codon:yes gene_type:complete
LLGVLADFALAYVSYYSLLSFPVYASKNASLTSYLYKVLELQNKAEGQVYAEGLSSLIFVFGLYLAIRFYGSLVLGVSFSQWLLGLRAVGNSTWKRIGAGARVVLELFLGPLLIGEILLLFNRPSLKESLSHTRLSSTDGKFSLYAGLIWVPCLILFSTTSPLFKGLSLMQEIVVNPVRENLNLKDQGSFDGFTNYKSNRFKFRAFNSLGDDRFMLLPNFEIVKEGSNKKIKPYLWLYDHKTQKDAYIKIEERFSLLSLLENAKLGNPLFKKQYPILFDTLGQKREQFLKRKYEKAFENKKILSEEVSLEIQDLIYKSLRLGSGSLIAHVFREGPFIRGFTEVRNKIIEKSFKGAVPEIDFGKIGNQNFLRFKQLFEEKVFLDKRMVETYIPIETNNSLTLRFYWGEDLKSALSRKNFRESFLHSIDWYFDYFNIFDFPISSEEVNSLTVLDYFTKTILNKEQRDKLEDAIFRIYFKSGRRALQKNDEVLVEILYANLNRLYLVSNYINESKRNYYSNKFLVHLRDLRQSLKSRDFNYFGIIKK